MKFTGTVHGVIDLPSLVYGPFHLRRHRYDADHMPFIESHHGLLVFGAISSTRLFMAQQGLLNIWRQFAAQPVSFLDPQRHTGEGAGENEADYTLWLGQHILDGEHPAP